MKYIGLFVLAIFSINCRSDQDLRAMIQEEMAKASAKTYYPSQDVIGPYSPAVKAGSTLFISGQIALNPESGELAGNDIESQTKQAMTNLMAVLARAGYDSSDLVQCTVFLRDVKEFQKMNLIYGGFFAENKYPARSTVEVSNLPKNARVEIAGIAFKSK